jgi:cytochrome P450
MPTTTDPRSTPIPRPTGIVATIAAARGLTGDPCPTLDALGDELGATFEIAAGPVRIVVIGKPEHLTEIYATPTDAFLWGFRLNVLRFYVGDGSMIVSDGDDHRRRRGAVQPGFARRRLDGWAPMIVAEADRTIDETILPQTGVIDLFPIGRRLVLRIVLNALFGAGFDDRAEEIDHLIEPAKTYLEQPAIRQVPHPFPYSRRARTRAARARFDRLIDAEVASRRAHPTAESGDLLDLLLAVGSDPDTGVSDSEIRDQVVTLIAAGYDTTTSSLGWTLLRAAGTPGVWPRLRAEADDELGRIEPGPATLQQLPYARAVVRETLRLHPAGVFSPRQATRDILIDGHTIRRGSVVLLCPYLAGRDPNAWPEPLRFDPGRHLSLDGVENTPLNPAWVPFGRGPRHCIGFALAEMELTLILSRFAQRLDLDLASAELPVPYGMVVNRPAGGVRAWVGARA